MMRLFKPNIGAAGAKKPSRQQFVVADLQTDLPLEKPLPKRLRITYILKNIRVLGPFTPYQDNPGLPRCRRRPRTICTSRIWQVCRISPRARSATSPCKIS